MAPGVVGFLKAAARRFAVAAPSPQDAERMAAFRRDGYLIMRGVFAPETVEAFWSEVSRQLSDNPDLTFSVGADILTNKERWAGGGEARYSLRVIDLERHLPATAEMMLHPVLVSFLTALYAAPPTCIQTLAYEEGSEQGPHSDKYLVSPPTAGLAYDRDTLAASWIAVDPADEENGALVIYPGSHRLEKKRLTEDFADDYGAYADYLHHLCVEAGCPSKSFRAEKGDVLFWHGDFVHAGGPIRDRTRTRRSLVSHYARLPAFHRPPDRVRRRRAVNRGYYFA